MAIEQKNVVHAAGSIVGTTGAVTAGQGFSASRSGQGVYVIQLELGADETECQILCTRRGTALRTYFAIAHTSDLVKTISILDSAGAALDSDFDFAVLRTAG